MPRLIRSQPLIPTQESASGVWSLDDAFNAVKTKTWPIAGRIVRSLRFNDDESSYLVRTPDTEADSAQQFTVSFWIKVCDDGSSGTIFQQRLDSNASQQFQIRWQSDPSNSLRIIDQESSTNQCILDTTIVFRDVAAWYHIVVTVDTTLVTSADRAKIYVNGERLTDFDSGTTVLYTQNYSTSVNKNGVRALIGSQRPNASSTLNSFGDYYLAEFVMLDGQALDPTSFGELRDGVWSPIDTAGLTFGTNGFYLKFNDSTDPGKDVSGNGNDFTANNLFANDVVIDSVKDNFCTLNPLATFSGLTLSNGNLLVNQGVDGRSRTSLATMPMPSSGKFYMEFICDFRGSGFNNGGIQWGLSKPTSLWWDSDASQGMNKVGVSVNGNDGNSQYLGSVDVAGYISGTAGSVISNNDVMMLAYDADTGKVWLGKNGVWGNNGGIGNPATGVNPLRTLPTSETWIPGVSSGTDSGATQISANFGQRPFAYTPPEGYLPLSTDALPATVTPSDYFNTVLWTGNNGTQSITGVGFQPDLLWIKVRNEVNSHYLFDQIRGADQALFTDSTSAEVDYSATGRMTSFDSDGFTVEYSSSTGTNASGDTYVAWCWKAGGAPVSNTDGSIASQVSANTDAGFSIVSYTGNGVAGSNVGHGLGKAPGVIISKNRDASDSWPIYHQSTSNIGDSAQDVVYLNLTTVGSSDNIRSVNDTTFALTSWGGINGNGNKHIAYCFAEIEGFSKFGSYPGNALADGPFVYTGFRPAFVMVKSISSGDDRSWAMYDNKRDSYNPVQLDLAADLTNSEGTKSSTYRIDFLSNGFKLKSYSNWINMPNETFIYMAFAETPSKTTRAR